MSASRAVLPTLAASVAALLIAAPAGAKTYEVTKRADHTPNGCKKKDCSLREAVLAANAKPGADRIVLPERKTYNLSIENEDPSEDAAATGDLDVIDSLRVTHPGKGRAKVDANGIDRVFELLGGGSTTFKKIVISGGDDAEGDDNSGGGGVQADNADLTLRRSSVSGNHADGSYGGGVELNGGPEASFTVIRSALSGNSSASDSGALEAGAGPVVIERSKVIGNTSGGNGGGLYLDTDEPSRIVNSTIAGNRADDGGGGVNALGPLTIEGSTFANNRALNANGGGVRFSDDGEVFDVRNSTFAGNSASDDGGGLYISAVAEFHANALTIARNSAEDGGGVFNVEEDPVEFENSLIALNSATASGDDCAFDEPEDEYDSLGHNLLGDDTDCEGFDASGDFVNSNPKLGQLKSNGGPTQTVALKKGSPAINAADKASAPKKDQRGEKRGKKPDIGAYERIKKKKKGRR